MSSPSVPELADTPLFAELSQGDLLVLSSWLESEEVSVGQHLTQEGASGYAFFVLHEGTADVQVDGAVVRTLRANDYFGEVALFEDEGRRTATVVVTSPGVVWTLFGTRFRQLQQRYPDIAAAIQRSASERHG